MGVGAVHALTFKKFDWLKIRSGHGILIYSAGQGLTIIQQDKD